MTTRNQTIPFVFMAALLFLPGCDHPMLGCAGCVDTARLRAPAEGSDAFLSAAEQGDIAVIRAKLALGISVNVRGPRGETALLRASRSGHGEIVALLLAEGADVNAASGEYVPVLRLINGQQVWQSDFNLFSTPLMVAAENGHTKVMRNLIEHGAKVNAASYIGVTALKLAARRGDYEAVGVLLAAGAAVNHGAQLFGREGSSPTALMYAADGMCWHGHAKSSQPESFQKTVEMLLKAGARTDIQDQDGDTAFSDSINCPASGTAQILMRAGASMEDKDDQGLTVLSKAARNGDLAMVKLMLDNRADPNIVDMTKNTPLLYAVRARNGAMVDVLVKAGANINVADQNGKTPLMIAIEEDDLGAVDILTAHGADLNARTELGLTALHFARLSTGNNAAAIRKSLERAGMRE